MSQGIALLMKRVFFLFGTIIGVLVALGLSVVSVYF